ncbi:MAG: AI-2E family transporter [Tissierellia bacterium]|nr:AI-2E family transporter [Tissierellia bacterium]
MARSTKILLNITLIFISILCFSLLRDFFKPIGSVLGFLLVPLILSIYIYYALKPLKNFMLKYIKHNNVVTGILFLTFILLFILFIYLIGNILVKQVLQLVNNFNIYDIYQQNQSWIDKFGDYIQIDKWLTKISQQFQKILMDIPYRITNVAGSISTIATQFLLMIFSIFYFLKDSQNIYEKIDQQGEGPYHREWMGMVHGINKVLETYISGQMTVSFILGIMNFIGFLIIGMPSALLLSLIALVTNLIPYVGPFIGAAPAILIALTMGPTMALKVALVCIIVQQLESNLVSPNIMGQKLDIHPLVVMIVVLISMRLFGVLGALIATPTYLILVILLQTLYKIYFKSKNMCAIPVEEKKDEA